MGRNDWYRKQTWSVQDAADFQQRLHRSRGNASKAQYLRIQALHLADVGLHEPALELLSQLLRDFPETSELASTHLQRAQSYAARGDDEKAITCFREALAAEDAYPNVQPGTPLDFAWFIITRERTTLYSEVEPLLHRHEEKQVITLPIERFKCAAARAIIANSEGRLLDARRFASEAHNAANEPHSSLRHHPNLGLVGNVPASIARQLMAIGTE